MTELAVYETHEEIFQRKSTMAELVADVSSFSQQSVLWVCASIVTGVQLWESISVEPGAYAQFLSLFFDDRVRLRLIAGYWGTPRRLVFHRRQILLVTKLAIMHCTGHGVDARRNARRFGPILLKANDQFDYGLLSMRGPHLEPREQYARLIKEMVAVEESSSPTIAHQMTRNHLMLTRFSDELRTDPRFVDIAGDYREQSGLSVAELEAMVFSVHARFGKELVQQAYRDPGVLPLKESNFSTTAITYEKVARFLDSVSASPATMAEELSRRDEGSNDVTIFRMFPLIQQYYNVQLTSAWFGFLLMDNRFLLEKALAGPYWLASSLRGGVVRPFWGLVFERYMNELMQRSCSGTGARFVPDPRPQHDPDVQLCDGMVIWEDALVVMEYKSCMFRADTKYRQGRVALAREIENKLVHDQEADERKGVEQLAATLKRMFGGREVNAPSGLDLSRVRRVYPYLVTLDSIGGTLGMSAFLNTYLAEILSGEQFAAKIRPLFCSNVAELEDKSGYFLSHPLPRILEAWYRADPNLIAPLDAISLPPAEWTGNHWLAAEWDAIFREMTAILYPGVDPGPGMAEAVRRRQAVAAR